MAIARTQLGYEESSLNFIVDEEGMRKGYTRYGDWFGSDYGDWCAMQLVKKDFDKLVDGGASSPATATPTSFC